MFVYLSKKISTPNNSQIQCVSWMKTLGFIATGGEQGFLKVLKLPPNEVNRYGQQSSSSRSSTNLTVNQNLNGHKGNVLIAEWNEFYHKLTTSDSNGLIVLWLVQNDNWFEEMINNRNKSAVIGMAWSHDGHKIVIAYKDGQTIVGSVEGNRLWSRNIANDLLAVCWSRDSSMLYFGLDDGEVLAYDASGTFIQKVHMVCLEKDLHRDTIISMNWFVPVFRSEEHSVLKRSASISNDRPKFLVAYRHGVIQVMRNENDANPVIIKLPNMILCKAKWSPDGSVIAICGILTDKSGQKCVIHFASAYGEPLRNLQIPGQTITDISWESEGLRLCAAVDSHLFFANIRPNYKWAYCSQTIIYTYEKVENAEHCVVFFETKLEETFLKYTKQVLAITSCGEYCVLITRAQDQVNQYFMQICNGIGTTLDSKYFNIEPKYVAMNETQVVIANNLSFTTWQYSIPYASSQGYNTQSDASNSFENTEQRLERKHSYFLAFRDSGTVHRYALPDVTFQSSFTLNCRVEKVELNCAGTRIAVLTNEGLKLYKLTENNAEGLNFVRHDAWNMKWDEEKDDSIAIMEKSKLYIVRNTETEEPVVNGGYICCFRSLIVRTVLLDEIMQNPQTPHKSFIIDVEIKVKSNLSAFKFQSFRHVKNLLDNMKIHEATAFIEKSNHPKLWALLAEVALNRLDTAVAEHAYVMLKDYAGIQLIKRINALQSDELKKAEVAAFYGRIDEAEKIYIENDRFDLAIALREKMNDWFQISDMLQKNNQPNDELLRKAWNNIGDYYVERQKWKEAESYYEKAENYAQLIPCYLMNDEYEKLEQMAKQLPDNHELLVEIGELFLDAGLCEEAVQCFIKWEYAVELSKTHNLRDIDTLLNRYVEQFKGNNERTLAVVQLYKKAGKYLQAARMIFDIASNERKKHAEALRMKKLYVLGALLVEQYHKQSKAEVARDSHNKSEAEIALKGLLEEDSKLSLSDSILIDNAWRGAEAYHFYMLSQRQLYEGDVDRAMTTALLLTDYEDFIEPVEIYSLLALSSCVARQFGVCSRAFIKLESLDSFTADEKKAYQKLALNIYTKYPPEDTRVNHVLCTECNSQIPDFCSICPVCEFKFSRCIASGRPILDYQFWLCSTCKHRAYQKEMDTRKFCPLCHEGI
ncbi:unnamed protein product [Thelazia callipaeda]|uniref:WD_REPEATS_REGION domain-containing protein n=1 Tax=Thelazia callipaeda TaxID=103827 RepID=A0A158RB20_THECL|nr:unnamed protein product [Thelazia callipaeda]